MTQRHQLRGPTTIAFERLLRACGAASLLSACVVCGTISAQAQQGSDPDPGVAAAISGNAKPEKAPRIKAKDGRSAEDAFIAGARLLEHNDREGAEREFTRATTIAPDNPDYAMALSALRNSDITELVHRAGRARLLGHDIEAESLLAQARAIDPNNPILLQHPVPGSITEPGKVNSWIVDGPRLAGPIQLKPTAGVKSFHIRATISEAVRQVASAYGIKASLDSSVGNQQVRFDLDDVPYELAIRVLMQMGTTFAVPLTPESILVAKDNEENRQKYLRQIQETIYAAGMTNEQLAELGNMIKSVFEVKQVSVENSFGTLVIRAPEETLRVLNLTLADMLDGGSEVMIDLKLYSVDRMRTVNIGATVPSQASAFSFASQANALVAANQSLVNQAIAQGLISAGASNVEIAIALLESGLVSSSLLTNLVGSFGGGNLAVRPGFEYLAHVQSRAQLKRYAGARRNSTAGRRPAERDVPGGFEVSDHAVNLLDDISSFNGRSGGCDHQRGERGKLAQRGDYRHSATGAVRRPRRDTEGNPHRAEVGDDQPASGPEDRVAGRGNSR